MADMRLDNDDDLAVTAAGDIRLVSSEQEIIQMVNLAVRTRINDVEFDLEYGNELFSKKLKYVDTSIPTVSQDSKDAINKLDIIDSIENVDAIRDGAGVFRIIYAVTTTSGLIVNSTIPLP